MTLSRSKFETIWWLAAALGGISVIVADGGINHVPGFVVPTTLGLSISIAAFLSLFVKRDKPEEVTEKGNQHCATEAHVSMPNANQVIEIAETPTWKPYTTQSIATMYYIDEPSWAQARVANYVKNHMAMWQIAESQTIWKQFLSEHQETSRRRNVLAEAVEIAKKLRGSGIEVAIGQDDCILLRHREKPQDSGLWPMTNEKASLPAQREAQLLN